MPTVVFLRNPFPLNNKKKIIRELEKGAGNLVWVQVLLGKPPSFADEVNTDIREGGSED